MDIRLAVAIAAHPARLPWAQKLSEYLFPWVDGLAVSLENGNGEWDTHSRAWMACLERTGTTHGLVLEDDAIPCWEFMGGPRRAIERFPDSAISLYFGDHENKYNRASRVRRARDAARLAGSFDDVSWISTPGLWWGVAVILPVAWIEPMLAYWSKRKTGLYDERISKWITMHEKGPVLNTWPSLVDHADGPSLLRRNRKPGRKAFRTAQSALDWDPNGRVITA